MEPDLRLVSQHMRSLGLGALTHALRLSLYSSQGNPSWPELSVLHAAHAAEVLLKARIAEEHPLLIFTQIPRSTQASGSVLSFVDLFEKGQTVEFNDLPERLWAVTGKALPANELYRSFGRYRNAIHHFAPPADDPSQRTLEFVFRVLDPFLVDNWGLYAIDFNEEYGDHYEHVFESLVSRDIRPSVSPTAAQVWKNLGYVPGPEAPAGYAEWYRAAMERADPS